jgi:hypothetical protein
LGGPSGGLIGQPALSYAGLSSEDEQAAHPGRCRLKASAQLSDLTISPDEHRRCIPTLAHFGGSPSPSGQYKVLSTTNGESPRVAQNVSAGGSLVTSTFVTESATVRAGRECPKWQG